MLKNRTRKSKKYDHITKISDEMTEQYVEHII